MSAALLLLLGTHAVAQEPPARAALGASQVVLPISVNLDEAQRWVETALTGLGPQQHSDEKCAGGELGDIFGDVACIDVDINAAVVPGSVRLDAVPDGLAVSAVVDVAGSAGGSALDLSADGQLQLQGTIRPSVNPDWSVNSNLHLAHHWPNNPDLKMRGIHLGTVTSLADKAVDKAKSKAVAKVRDQFNGSSGLRGVAEEAWRALHEPRELTDGVWLQFRPTGLGVAPFVGEGRRALMRWVVEGRPMVSLSKPSDATSPPLPPPVKPQLSLGTRIALIADASFEEIEQRLAELAPSKTWEVPFAGMQLPVSVSDWQLHAGGGTLRVGAEVAPRAGDTTPFKAWLWLSAKPVFDEASQELHLTDLAVAQETDAVLAPLARVLAGDVQKSLRVDVGDKFSELVGRLPDPLELSFPIGRGRESLTLRVQDLHPRVAGVEVGNDRLTVVLMLGASVTGEFAFGLPIVGRPPPIHPGMRNGRTPPMGPPHVRPGHYARAPIGRAAPNFVPRPPLDLGRPLSNCACWHEPINTVATLGPGMCSSSRAITVACGPPCFNCVTPMCMDGAPIRQRICTY